MTDNTISIGYCVKSSVKNQSPKSSRMSKMQCGNNSSDIPRTQRIDIDISRIIKITEMQNSEAALSLFEHSIQSKALSVICTEFSLHASTFLCILQIKAFSMSISESFKQLGKS